jgi:hypothetical protein
VLQEATRDLLTPSSEDWLALAPAQMLQENAATASSSSPSEASIPAKLNSDRLRRKVMSRSADEARALVVSDVPSPSTAPAEPNRAYRAPADPLDRRK